jgi:pimeloyl-ACP methyl ester carboxylesterase
MSGFTQPSVTRRAVFLIGGYERNDSAGFFRRLRRELDRFRACWSVKADMGAPETAAAGIAATAPVEYRGPDGLCRTDLTFLSFDDIVYRDGARPFVVRLLAYIVAVTDYVFSGTLVRFFRANWRFALYFLYPLVALAAFVWGGTLAYRVVARFSFSGMPLVAVLVGCAVTVALGWAFGRRYFVFHLMDLWSFSREHLRCRRPDMDARIDEWAALIDERLAATSFDEVLLVGHSTGGAIILDVADRLVQRLAAQDRTADFTLLTVGSTSLKVALHPAAHRARSRLEGLARHKTIRWTEFQALTDIINFYKCDPYRMAGLTHDRRDAFPLMYQVRFREMLNPDAYKRIKRNFFRVHYQFISANSRRYFFDFLMICCGTRRLEAVAPDRLPLCESLAREQTEVTT